MRHSGSGLMHLPASSGRHQGPAINGLLIMFLRLSCPRPSESSFLNDHGNEE
jgi:hypothetical protein